MTWKDNGMAVRFKQLENLSSPKCLKTYIKTAMRLKEFEDRPQTKQRSLVQKVKKVVRIRWLSLDARVEAAYKEYTYLLCALRSVKDEEGASKGATAAGVLKKVDDMKFLAVLCFETYITIFINIE